MNEKSIAAIHLPEQDYITDGKIHRCTFRQEVKHCVGLDYPNKPYRLYHRHGKAYWKAWRNFFDTGRIDSEWEKLVDAGYAWYTEHNYQGRKGRCYHLTPDGIRWLSKELGIIIKMED